jgi:hypothetical protein
VFIPHDLDQVIRNANAPIIPAANGVVAQAILKTPDLSRRYITRFGTLFTNVFNGSKLTAHIDQAVAQIEPAVSAYDQNLAHDLQNHANGLKHRFLNRARFLARQLDVSPFEDLLFHDNSAKLTNWRPASNTPKGQQDQVKDAAGKTALWLSAADQTKVSWRKRVKLEPGHYRFEGLARCTSVVPAGVARKGEGVGLRISGTKQPRDNKLSGDSDWEKLTYEFDAPPDSEVELVCELCASRGEAWFDTDSLKLVRIK